MLDLALLSDDLRAFYALWDAKRGGRLLPARSDLEFAELRPWLESLHIVEVLADDFRFKIFATNSTLRLGAEMTGQLLSKLEPRQLAEDAGTDYRRCVETRTPIFADRTRQHMDGRMF